MGMRGKGWRSEVEKWWIHVYVTFGCRLLPRIQTIGRHLHRPSTPLSHTVMPRKSTSTSKKNKTQPPQSSISTRAGNHLAREADTLAQASKTNTRKSAPRPPHHGRMWNKPPPLPPNAQSPPMDLLWRLTCSQLPLKRRPFLIESSLDSRPTRLPP